MSFADEIYSKLKQIPKGKVITYKGLALMVGSKAYRAVGQVLKNNPYAPEVPCHRVVRSDGKIGGFMGKINGKEIEIKIARLQAEGVKVSQGKVDLAKYLQSK